jgi:ribosome maturation factor RimP
MNETQEKVTALAESIAAQHGVRLFDVEIAGSAQSPLIRVYIDKDNGITLDECANFSRSLAALFDVEDPIPSAYVLEVSSPGLDRKLKKLRHFELSIGKQARVVLKKQPEGQGVFTGTIMEVRGDTIILLTGDEKEVLIPFDAISKARLEMKL